MEILTMYNDCDLRDILALLGINSDSAVVLMQKYGLCEGTDLVVWYLDQYDKAHRVEFATGPIRRRVCIDTDKVKLSQDLDIPRSQRIEMALDSLDSVDNEEWLSEFATENSSLRESVESTSIAEFNRVRQLVESNSLGCRNVFGVESTLRCGFIQNGIVEFECKSWDGEIDAQSYWKNMNEVLEIAGIADLELREFQS